MSTNNGFSFASFVAYGNATFNNTTGNTPTFQEAGKTFLKKAIAHAGYPNKDEIGVIDTINDFDYSPITKVVPELVSGYMRDEKRSFDIPAADKNTCAATVKVVAVEEKTKTGTIMLGDKKGETYTSTTAAHEELVVKNRRDPFKK